MTLLALLLAVQAANLPELPTDVPASATSYDVLILEKPAGQMAPGPRRKESCASSSSSTTGAAGRARTRRTRCATACR